MKGEKISNAIFKEFFKLFLRILIYDYFTNQTIPFQMISNCSRIECQMKNKFIG